MAPAIALMIKIQLANYFCKQICKTDPVFFDNVECNKLFIGFLYDAISYLDICMLSHTARRSIITSNSYLFFALHMQLRTALTVANTLHDSSLNSFSFSADLILHFLS
jgi:hypothetical protein